jgi:hypothetical protein
MKIIKMTEKESNIEEMKEWFDQRTKKHIALVKKYCQKIKEYGNGEFDELTERAENHDKSKFEDPENTPYIYLTWNYKCKANGKEYKYPDGMEDKTNDASEHHIKNNSHHPEYHCDKKTNLINKKDRDKAPEEMIDATKMKDIDIAEMCADFCAVSEERGTNPEDWADKNINKRWKFSKYQEALIYELIDIAWNKQNEDH